MDNLNEHLRGDRQHPYNDPSKWVIDGIWNRPNINIPPRKFQRQINRITGLTTNGHPILKLVWAWDERIWIDGLLRQKYRAISVGINDKTILDVAPPRWLIEQRIEPGQYLEGWNAKRFGDPPLDGWYNRIKVIADHEEHRACCDRARAAFAKGQRRSPQCWGLYREPEQDTLDEIRQAKALLEESAYQNPHEPLSARTVAQIALDEADWNEARENQLNNTHRDMWGDFWATSGWRLGETDPGVLHHGRLHDVAKNYQRASSGLLVPKSL